MNKKTLKIISFTSLVIFNLFVVFAATFAWFVSAVQLKSTEIAVKIEAHELHLDYEIYKFDDASKEVIEVESLSLNPYDTVIKERNKNNAIIIKATLESDFFIDKDYYNIDINITCSDSSYYTDSLSNITHFKFAALANVEDDYNDSISLFSDITSQTFITTVKLTSIDFTVFNAPIVNNKVIVYGLFDYDEDLISARDIDITDEVPVFTNDIDYIRFNVHE